MDGVLLGALFMTGLAGSLHCLGMCGPLLLSFASIRDERGGHSRLDFWAYHAGRIWTYGLLGFLAGWLAARGSEAMPLDWQPSFGVVIGMLVILAGLASFGWIPGWRPMAVVSACASAVRSGWLSPWLRGRRLSARLILGAIMGFLPCGLVYSALLVAVTLGGPARSAFGMIIFGLGTTPALGALLLSRQLVPSSARWQGTRIVAALTLVMGLFILWRALMAGHGHASH